MEGKSFRQKILSGLTTVAHGSTPFITTFILIHLAAPALANIGGSSLASRTMILGREYYQTSFGEKYLVLGPLAVHSFAGLAKRLLSPPESRPRPLRSLLSLTGYSTMLLLLPVHYLVHRVYPAIPTSPIYAVGPAELDFEFVKFGLQKWPLRSCILYAGLVCCVALHLVDGSGIIWNTWLRHWGRIKNRNRRITQMMIGMVVPVLSGLFVMSREPLMMFSSVVRRFEAVFNNSLVYKL